MVVITVFCMSQVTTRRQAGEARSLACGGRTSSPPSYSTHPTAGPATPWRASRRLSATTSSRTRYLARTRLTSRGTSTQSTASGRVSENLGLMNIIE